MGSPHAVPSLVQKGHLGKESIEVEEYPQGSDAGENQAMAARSKSSDPENWRGFGHRSYFGSPPDLKTTLIIIPQMDRGVNEAKKGHHKQQY
jgi:hypothetical protein